MSNSNLVIQCNRAFVSNVPGAPGKNATVVLFSTHAYSTIAASTFTGAAGGKALQVSPEAIEEVRVVFHKNNQASAANGLRAYARLADGTWVETDMKGDAGTASIGAGSPVQVPALSAGQEWSEKFLIGAYRGFALTHTAGATAPTEWAVTVSIKHVDQE